MAIVDQIFYDIELTDNDELGKELVLILNEEQKLNKSYQIIVHQVITLDRNHYTVILNLLELE